MYSMGTQIHIVQETRRLEQLNEKLRHIESHQVDADEELIMQCFDFDGLMKHADAKQIFYDYIPDKTHVFFLIKIEEYKRLCAAFDVESVLDIAQEIASKMNELQNKEQQNDLISESGLSRTLDIFFQMKDSRKDLEESLFDDV